MTNTVRVCALLLAATVGGACDPGTPSNGSNHAAAPNPSAGGVVVARVNGVALYEEDVQLASAALRRGPRPDRDQVIESLVRAELVAQAARRKGLADDPSFQQVERAIAARANAERRKALAALYDDAIEAKARPTDADARAYFDTHRAAIQAELHAFQILVRHDRAAADAMLADIRAGTPFEDVAARQFREIPAGHVPWDLGFLSWKQIPAPWRDAVFDLADGDVSDVIAGPGERYWIVKVVERRTNSSMTFDAALPLIRDAVAAERLDDVRAAADRELRAGAKIEILPVAAPPPAPDDDDL